MLNHRVQHLCGNNHGLLTFNTFLNNISLNLRDFFRLDLDSQITAGNHHPVSIIQNLVNIIHSLLILNLGNNLDFTSPGIQNSLYCHNILLITYE